MTFSSHPEGQGPIQASYSEIDHAMIDTVLDQAAQDAKIFENRFNAAATGDINQLRLGVERLDNSVSHLLGSFATIKGGDLEEDGTCKPEDSNGQKYIAMFNGFAARLGDDSGQVHIDYLATIVTDSSGKPMSFDEFRKIRPKFKTGKVSLSGEQRHFSIETAKLDFEQVTPLRAKAWLKLAHPELFQQLRSIVETSPSEDPYKEDALLGLKKFHYDASDETDGDYIFGTMLERSVNAYLADELNFDKRNGYLVRVDGLHYLKTASGLNPVETGRYPMSNHEYYIDLNGVNVSRKFNKVTNGWVSEGIAIQATRHGRPPHRSSAEIIIPIESLAAIGSVRKIVFSALDASRGLGRAGKEGDSLL